MFTDEENSVAVQSILADINDISDGIKATMKEIHIWTTGDPEDGGSKALSDLLELLDYIYSRLKAQPSEWINYERQIQLIHSAARNLSGEYWQGHIFDGRVNYRHYNENHL